MLLDPDVALAALRLDIREVQHADAYNRDPSPDVARQLAGHAHALDEHVTSGGSLPTDWQR